MASKAPKIHRLGLGRLVVEGNLQPIVRAATLTFKDEKPDKQIMQVHVDGHTLAQWDLIMLRERKLAGTDRFFTITEQKMLQLTLPLFEPGGQKVVTMKTIQLFLLIVTDFHIAVDYLSNKAGMQHCHINQVLQSLRGASTARPGPISRPPGSTGMYRRPPTAPPMRRPMRPQSQSSIHAPVKYSPLEPVHRPQTTRPIPARLPGISSQIPSTASSIVPIGRRLSSQEHRYWSDHLVGPPDRRSSVVPDDSNHSRRLFSTGFSGGNVEERRPVYDYSAHLGSVGIHTPSDTIRPDAWRPLSNSQVGTDFGDVPYRPHHKHFPGRPASNSGQTLHPPRRIMSTTTYPFERRPASQPLSKRPTSRSSPFSDRGLPIRIQVLGLPDEPKYSSLHPKIRWEFTLHLLPTTKIWELCLHAASYIRREYHATVDGRTLAAQSMDGTLFEDQTSLLDGTMQRETIRLIERKLSSTNRSIPANSRESDPEPIHPDRITKAGKLDRSRHASPPSTFPRIFDEGDLPPPRQLPFPMRTTPASPRSSSATVAARSPLIERPDLRNANPRSRPNQTPTRPITQEDGSRAAALKQPNNRQKPSFATTKRPASSVSGTNLDSVSGITNFPEPRTSITRPGTSPGIHRKRKTLSGDGEVPTAAQPVTESLLPDNQDGTKQLAGRACIGCRNKKRKCDRSQPACGPCLKDKRPCTYPITPKPAATDLGPVDACNKSGLDILVPRSHALASPPMVSDASAQVNHADYRDIGSQTEALAHDDQDAEIRVAETDSTKVCTDASTETDKCDDLWVSFSQCAQLVLWAGDQYKRQIQKAAEILRTTDPSQDDYKDKVSQAAVYAWEFENEFREKCEQTLAR